MSNILRFLDQHADEQEHTYDMSPNRPAHVHSPAVIHFERRI